ncbi:MAG: CDP-diacylglycerol--glycerol-3-phosphate 3-phosphatidyltransferase [Clostridia bacterium]|nr:CDP-diacylglycerol--glycerol-3-phosphate 3-phosphatidyltransferase [Clostridia bacterium]
MTTATKITLARIALIPVFIVTFLVEFPYHYLISGLVYILSASTDWVDGAIARKTGTVTNLGRILDPVADKALSISAMILFIGGKVFYFEIAFIVMISIMIFRELSISIMRLYVLYHGKTLAADALGKIKTIFLNIAVPVLVIDKQFEYLETFNAVWKWIGCSLFFIAFVMTVVSGINYLVKNKQVVNECREKDKNVEENNDDN